MNMPSDLTATTDMSAPLVLTVSAAQVEAAWAAWFPSTSGPWSTGFRWRLYKALADLGVTVTGGMTT